MRTLFITLSVLILIPSACLTAQKIPIDYFDEAEKFTEKNELEKAFASYEYIVKNHPRNELYPRALFNMAYISSEKKDFEKAIPIFKTFLQSNFNEYEESGGDLMSDPYASYKHRSSDILSLMYEEKEMYDSALYYLSLSDTVYLYQSFCGNGYASRNIEVASRYSTLYTKLNQQEKAIQVLLPSVFDNELADNSEILSKLGLLLKGRKNLKVELDRGLDSMYQKSYKSNETTYTMYLFRFLNTEIVVPYSWEYDSDKSTKTPTPFNRENAIKNIKTSDFYKVIESL